MDFLHLIYHEHSFCPMTNIPDIPNVYSPNLFARRQMRVSGSGSECGLSRNGTISLLCILLGREEEAVSDALKVSITFSKEICHLLCNQKGKTLCFWYTIIQFALPVPLTHLNL